MSSFTGHENERERKAKAKRGDLWHHKMWMCDSICQSRCQAIGQWVETELERFIFNHPDTHKRPKRDADRKKNFSRKRRRSFNFQLIFLCLLEFNLNTLKFASPRLIISNFTYWILNAPKTPLVSNLSLSLCLNQLVSISNFITRLAWVAMRALTSLLFKLPLVCFSLPRVSASRNFAILTLSDSLTLVGYMCVSEKARGARLGGHSTLEASRSLLHGDMTMRRRQMEISSLWQKHSTTTHSSHKSSLKLQFFSFSSFSLSSLDYFFHFFLHFTSMCKAFLFFFSFNIASSPPHCRVFAFIVSCIRNDK